VNVLGRLSCGRACEPRSRCSLLRCRDEFGFYFLGEALKGFLGTGEIANSVSVEIPSLFKSARVPLGNLPAGENPALPLRVHLRRWLL
jgi:hypothetical protein